MTDPIQPAGEWQGYSEALERLYTMSATHHVTEMAKMLFGPSELNSNQVAAIWNAAMRIIAGQNRERAAEAWHEGYRQAVTDVVGPQEEILDWQLEQNPYRSES